MKRLVLVLLIVALAGCASSTVIKTLPAGAKVYNSSDKLVGVTPYDYWDRDFSFAQVNFTLKSPGYKDKPVMIERDVLYVHRILFPPVISVPWLFGYETEYFYEMERE